MEPLAGLRDIVLQAANDYANTRVREREHAKLRAERQADIAENRAYLDQQDQTRRARDLQAHKDRTEYDEGIRLAALAKLSNAQKALLARELGVPFDPVNPTADQFEALNKAALNRQIDNAEFLARAARASTLKLNDEFFDAEAQARLRTRQREISDASTLRPYLEKGLIEEAQMKANVTEQTYENTQRVQDLVNRREADAAEQNFKATLGLFRDVAPQMAREIDDLMAPATDAREKAYEAADKAARLGQTKQADTIRAMADMAYGNALEARKDQLATIAKNAQVNQQVYGQLMGSFGQMAAKYGRTLFGGVMPVTAGGTTIPVGDQGETPRPSTGGLGGGYFPAPATRAAPVIVPATVPDNELYAGAELPTAAPTPVPTAAAFLSPGARMVSTPEGLEVPYQEPAAAPLPVVPPAPVNRTYFDKATPEEYRSYTPAQQAMSVLGDAGRYLGPKVSGLGRWLQQTEQSMRSKRPPGVY